MEYTYNILNEVYNWMLSKHKNIELRILKEKSKKIKVGDFITFNNLDQVGKFIRVKVISKELFDNLDDLLKIPPECRFNDKKIDSYKNTKEWK